MYDNNRGNIFLHQSYYDELIKFMISGPSHVLVLTKGNTGETVVTDVRELLGPKNVEEAKEEAPDRCVVCKRLGGF